MGATLKGLPRQEGGQRRPHADILVRLCALSVTAVLLAACGLPAAPDAQRQEQGYQLVVVNEEAIDPVLLDGAVLRGAVTVELSTTVGVARAAYYVGQAGLSIAPASVPAHDAPREGLRVALDTVALEDGEHDVTAVVYRKDGATEVISARFSVDN